MRPLKNLFPIMSCGALLILFYVIGYCCFKTESPTIDEPVHAIGGYVQCFKHDFRANPEDPPLWKTWAMLPHHDGELHGLPDEGFMSTLAFDVTQAFAMGTRVLFETPANDGVAFINRSRAVMLLLGVALGAVIAAWSWRLAGAAAGLAACTLFAFDPNMIGHAALVKNDVCLSLVFLCTMWSAWSVGVHGKWRNILTACVVCALGPVVKFSGVMIGPIFVILMFTRAIMPLPWMVLGRPLSGRGARLIAAASLSIAASLVSYGMIWACYDFRFDPTPQSGEQLNMRAMLADINERNFLLANGVRPPSPSELDAIPLSTTIRLVLWAERHRLLPQAWLFGFLYTYQSTLVRPSFLLNEVRVTGWWYYFPLAALFKTPLATLAAIVATAIIGANRLRRKLDSQKIWAMLCLLIPLAIYAAASINTNLNIGIRHIFPMYAIVYVLIGIVAAHLWKSGKSFAKPIMLILALCLAGETLAAFPNYISFFNLPSSPYKLHLLSDSNLDWGQDLPRLAKWQSEHPNEKLFVAYFGSVVPEAYHIRCDYLPAGIRSRPDTVNPDPSQKAVFAVSATILQTTYISGTPAGLWFNQMRDWKPREVLGDTIYLYDWPPKP